MSDSLVVLYEDAHLLAVFKPSGILTQGMVVGEPTLEDQVRQFLGFPSFLGTVHRLDRPVSGVVIWSKSVKAARRLTKAFQTRQVVKEYWAIVEGGLDGPSHGVWDSWLTRSTNQSGRIELVTPHFPGARRAVTHWERGRVANSPEAAWLVLQPQTGRTHQLRVQASRSGMPIWGDALYGSTRVFHEGIALHSRALTFSHPVQKQTMTVSVDPPRAWIDAGFERSDR